MGQERKHVRCFRIRRSAQSHCTRIHGYIDSWSVADRSMAGRVVWAVNWWSSPPQNSGIVQRAAKWDTCYEIIEEVEELTFNQS
jgi:hypothetical protein